MVRVFVAVLALLTIALGALPLFRRAGLDSLPIVVAPAAVGFLVVVVCYWQKRDTETALSTVMRWLDAIPTID